MGNWRSSNTRRNSWPTAPLAPGGYTVEAWAVKDSGELDELQVRMRRQVKKFSWKKNAEQMLQILCRRDKEPYQAPRRMLQIQFRKDGEAKR